MDVKKVASQLLVQKLANGWSDSKLLAVAEIRLFSKWNSDNRICLVQAGVLPLLIDLLATLEPKVQVNAITALLNLSIDPCNKIAIAGEPGGLDAILNVVRHGLSTESKANAAALLNSLVLEESLRPVLGSNPVLLRALLELLRDGSSSCKADCLQALFHIALCPPNRAKLVAVGAIPLLLAFVACGKVRLVEDSLAVLAKIAGCREGSASLVLSDTIPVIVSILDKGSPLAQENAADALANICEMEGERGKDEILDCRNCVSAIRSLYFSDSARGKSKAESLMKQLSVRIPSATTVYHHVREIRPKVEDGDRRPPADAPKEHAPHSAMMYVHKMETARDQRQPAACSKLRKRGFWMSGNFSFSGGLSRRWSGCFG